MRTVIVFLLIVGTACGMSLQWDANAPDDQVTAYNIYRVKDDSPELVGTVNAPTTIFNVDAFLEEQTNFYVMAVNDTGESPPSSTVVILRCSMWTTKP
jgi:hypothetical protein